MYPAVMATLRCKIAYSGDGQGDLQKLGGGKERSEAATLVLLAKVFCFPTGKVAATLVLLAKVFCFPTGKVAATLVLLAKVFCFPTGKVRPHLYC